MPEVFIISITLLSLVYFLALHILRSALNRIGLHEKESPAGKPAVSVIVCARNEENNLADLFHCLVSQDTASLDVEFIIVNDRSEDKTASMIENQAQKDKRFKYIHINDRLAGFAPKKRAIDTAVRHSKGELLLLTDADGRPGPAWIKSMVACFAAGADMVIGYAPYTANKDSNIMQKIMALEYFSIAMTAASTAALSYPVTCVGTNFAYRKKVYEEIGGFGRFKSFISGDDDLFLTLVREAGKYNIYYAADKQSHVYNAAPKSLMQFVNQRLRFASKGFNYPFKITFSLSLYVLFNLLVLAGLIWGIAASLTVLATTITVILFKTVFEYMYLRKAAQALSDSRFTRYYFLTAVLHLPYVLFFGILGQFKIFKWSENRLEHGVLDKREQY